MKITKRKIDAALREASFDPSAASTMRVILDVDDTAYFIMRAKEFLNLALGSLSRFNQVVHLTSALQLIAVAKARNAEENYTID